MPSCPTPAKDGEEWQRPSKPLAYSGTLDNFAYEESTPVIGREYLTLNIVDDLINAPNTDDLLRDLAITGTVPICAQKVK